MRSFKMAGAGTITNVRAMEAQWRGAAGSVSSCVLQICYAISVVVGAGFAAAGCHMSDISEQLR